MADGDLITNDWQIELPTTDGTGYLIGDDEPVGVLRIEGLEDLPEVRSADLPRPRAHGSFVMPAYATERILTVAVELASRDGLTLRQVVDDLAAATTIRQFEAPIVFQLPDMGKRRLLGRVIRRTLPVDLPFLYGLASGAIQIAASDPRIFDNTLRSGTTGVGEVVGGLGFPHGFPHGFGTATAGTIEIANDGNADAPWTATLTGPLTSPRISVVDGAGDLELAGFTLDAGETLELDSRDRTVLLGGSASRYGSLTRRGWFEIPPGASTVQLTAAAGTGTLTLRWRSAWL